jgi:hypothetical protein
MGVAVLRDMMERRYHEIKATFKRNSKAQGFKFSEDVFSESYLKCHEALKTKNMTEDEIIKYLWMSFVNNTRKAYRDIKHHVDIVEYLEDNDIPDTVYDERRYKIADTIVNSVKNKFEKEEFDAWCMHFVNNKSYEELKEMGYTFNFHNVFRNINNYIKKTLPKEDNEYCTILHEIIKKK